MRLDKYLLKLHPELTRSKIQDLIKRNLVLVNEKLITKTGHMIKESDEIIILESSKYASRAGLKLESATRQINLSFDNLIVIDVGSSTGGFTDYALVNNAEKVFAYDVGSNQMIDRLRNNERVILNEKTNILDINLPNNDLVLIDVSFTSSIEILKHVSKFSNQILLLIKPQFEVGAQHLKKGIVKDKKRVEIIIDNYQLLANSLGFKYKVFESGLLGKSGNQEYWLYLVK